MRFPLGRSPRVGNGEVVKGRIVTPGHLGDAGGNTGERVRLTRKICPSLLVRNIPDPGHPTPRRWKRLRPPLPPKERG